MENIAEKVLPIMRGTREMFLPYFGKIEVNRLKIAGDNGSAVTHIDEAVEKYLTEELKKIDPSIGFVGEEFGGDRNAKSFWLADPLDGTAHFVRGLPFCTSMLSLIEDGQVRFAVIYDFLNDIAYHAEKGKGAWQDDKPIKVNDRQLEDSYLAWETHLERPENLEKFIKLAKLAVPFKTVSSGSESILIATGKIEGKVCFDPYGKDYDFAPGSLLVAEAGGIVANMGKNTYDYRNLDWIASNKRVFESLTKGPDAIFPILE